MLWIVSNELQVSISTYSSKESFYKQIKGMKLEFKKDIWKIKFEHNNLVEFISNMKHPIVKHKSARSRTNYWTREWHPCL